MLKIFRLGECYVDSDSFLDDCNCFFSKNDSWWWNYGQGPGASENAPGSGSKV